VSANQEVARIFRQIGSALELLGANPFRANAYARAARAVRDLSEDLEGIVGEDPATAVDRLSEIPGIGKATAEKIVEFLDTGAVAEHEKLLDKVPAGLFEVLEIPGLGPKTVKLMWDELGITSVADLERHLGSRDLASLPRMGARTVDNIRKAIAFREKAGQRVPLGLARPLALDVVSRLEAVPGVRKAAFAGSVRRGCETIGDLDFLAVCDDAEPLREAFTGLEGVIEVLARGDTRCSVRLERRGVAIQADLRIVPAAAWGAALLYFTGSKDHCVHLREIAIQRDLHLNEYGLFPGTEARPQDRGVEPLAAADEAAVYDALGLPWVEPEMREEHGELDAEPPELIVLEDVVAELHAHTTASDGKLSIAEIAAIARARGFHTLAITDHSPSQPIANGLEPERLLRHVEAVREADAEIDGIRLLAGAEVDVLADGRLDYEDDLLERLDIVVASPHAALRQDPKTATARLLRAVRHPLVHILGHPTGRIINRREGLSPDMAALFEAAAEHDTALELNANWHRLDLSASHLRGALAHGCKIAIDTDAHREAHFDNLVYGILTARRAGMTAASCINTWPAKKLYAWLRSKR
jgi:DNA polymerase (family 10)